jgi:hypothetical protein
MTHYENLFQALCVGTIPTTVANKLAVELSMAKDRSNTNSKSIEALAGAVSELSAELTDLKLAVNNDFAIISLREDFEDFKSDTIKDINELDDLTQQIIGGHAQVSLDENGYECFQMKDHHGNHSGLRVSIESSGFPMLASLNRLVFHAPCAVGVDENAYMELRSFCDGFYGIMDAPRDAPKGTVGTSTEMTLKLDTTEFKKALAEAMEAIEKSLGDDWGTVLENVMGRLDDLEAFDELATKDIGRLFEFMRDSKKDATTAPPAKWDGSVVGFQDLATNGDRNRGNVAYLHKSGSYPGLGYVCVHAHNGPSSIYLTPNDLDELSKAAASLAAYIRSEGN